MTTRYKAFLSYSRQDQEVAKALQVQMERCFCPFYRLRGRRIYRDETDLSPGPDLWASLEDAILQSEWFVLLASPASSCSQAVKFELRTWFERKNRGRLAIIIVGGTVAFHEETGRVDWDRTDALPRWLQEPGATHPFDSEHLYWEDAPFLDLAQLAPGPRSQPVDGIIAALHESSVEAERRHYWTVQVLGILAIVFLTAIPFSLLWGASNRASIEAEDVSKVIQKSKEQIVSQGGEIVEEEAQKEAVLKEKELVDDSLRQARSASKVKTKEVALSTQELEVASAMRDLLHGDELHALGEEEEAFAIYRGTGEVLEAHGLSKSPIIFRFLEASAEDAWRIMGSIRGRFAGGRIMAFSAGCLVDTATGSVLAWAPEQTAVEFDSHLSGFRSNAYQPKMSIADLVTGKEVTLFDFGAWAGSPEFRSAYFFDGGRKLVVAGRGKEGGFLQILSASGTLLKRRDFTGQSVRLYPSINRAGYVVVLRSALIPSADGNGWASLDYSQVSQQEEKWEILDLNNLNTVRALAGFGSLFGDDEIISWTPQGWLREAIYPKENRPVSFPFEMGGIVRPAGELASTFRIRGESFFLTRRNTGSLSFTQASPETLQWESSLRLDPRWITLSAVMGIEYEHGPTAIFLTTFSKAELRTDRTDPDPVNPASWVNRNQRHWVFHIREAEEKFASLVEHSNLKSRPDPTRDLEEWVVEEIRIASSLKHREKEQALDLVRGHLQIARENGNPQGPIGLARIEMMPRWKNLGRDRGRYQLPSGFHRANALKLFEEAKAMRPSGDLLEYVNLCIRALSLPLPDLQEVTGEWERK